MRVALTLALTTLLACTSLPTRAAKEILDEATGNTLLIVRRPMVFARERTDVAAHARDYATLVAVEIDHSGKYGEYLLLYRWSTVDRRMSPAPDPQAGALRILAEGREIDLVPLEQVPVGLSRRRELHVPEHGDVVTHAYQTDVATLRYIAASRDLAVQLPQETLDAPFALWDDGRKALQDFVAGIGSAK